MERQQKINELKKATFENSGEHKSVQNNLVSNEIYRSWQRSFDSGILVNDVFDDRPHNEIDNILDKNRSMINLADNEMSKLYQLIKGTDNMVLLSDNDGVILNQIGDPVFVERAAKILLMPGAKWSEADKGTNAIGTAIKADKAITIHGGEHYLNSNGFLTCSSVPIHNPYGDILGVLDITGDYRNGNKHTLALLNMSVEHIENEMFSHNFHQDVIVELYHVADNQSWFEKTIMVFDFSGMLIAANKIARRLFSINKSTFNHKNSKIYLMLKLVHLLNILYCRAITLISLRAIMASNIMPKQKPVMRG